jgi:hypothetical protein
MSGFHLAGIVPVAGQPFNYNMPWHDCMMPLAPDYLAVERSVLECAYAGCETIWVICNDDMQPLIRYRLGDYVQDPIWAFRKYDRNISESQKIIPIYYVPIHPRDRAKRDCLGWSVLYGSYMSWKISRGMSKWLAPNKYYVSFPYGVYKVSFLREHRREISSDKTFLLTNNGKSIIDGEYLGFTTDFEETKRLTKYLKYEATENYAHGPKNFSLKEVFETIDFKDPEIVEIDYYWNIDSWDNYSKYISEIDGKIQRPSKNILNYHEFNKIGVDS